MVSVSSRDCTKPGLTPLMTPVLLIQQNVYVWLHMHVYMCSCNKIIIWKSCFVVKRRLKKAIKNRQRSAKQTGIWWQHYWKSVGWRQTHTQSSLFQIRSGHITKYTPPPPIPAFMFLQMPSQTKTATAVPVLAHIPNTWGPWTLSSCWERWSLSM